MARKDRIDLTGGAVLVAFSLLLGLNQALVKLVNEGFAPIFQAGLRSACAILPVLLYALWMRRLRLGEGTLLPGIAAGCLFAFEFVMLFQALDYTTVARASIFFYTMPVWVALGAHLLIPGERLTTPKVAGLALAVAGIALALGEGAPDAGEKALIGDLMCLAGALGWAGIALIARTTRFSNAAPEAQLLYQLVVSAPIMLAIAYASGDMVRDLTATHLGIFAFQILVVVCVGFMSWFWVLSIYPASDVASFAFLAPVFGVVFGRLVFGDPLTPVFVIALVLVALGIVLVNRRPKAPAAAL
ncbi:MAG: DMT family transporter [Pseudomonadota bacterium]